MVNTLAVANAQTGGGYTVLSNLVLHLAQVDRDNDYILVVSRANRHAFETSAPNFRYVALPVWVHRIPLRLVVDNVVVPVLANKYGVDVFFAPNDALPPGLHCRTVVGALNLIHYQARDMVSWNGAPLLERCRILLRRKYYRHKTPQAMSRADHVVAISQETRCQVIANAPGIRPERVEVVYPGVPPAFMTPLNGHPTARDNLRLPYILSTSAILPYKNFDKLITAFAMLEHKYHVPHQLVIVGSAPYPSYQVQLRQLAAQLGVANKVDFRGFVHLEELVELYRGAAVFVLLSSVESFGFPVLEAMACGVPVVTSNLSTLPEIVGDAGLTVNPEDVSAVAQVLGRILQDHTLRAELARQSRARAKYFSWERAALQIRRVFEEVYTSGRVAGNQN